MSIMQRQLEFVSAELAAIRNRPQHLHQPTQTPSSSNKPTDNRWTSRAPVSPSYVGPMSSEFGLNVPNDVDAPDLDETGISENVHTSMSNSPYAPPVPPEEENIDISSSNPLLSLTEAEALRLVNVYEDAVGLMYPVVDLKSIREYIIDFYHHNQDSSTGQLSPPQNGNEEWWFSARDTEVLKIVLALALISESHGRSDLGNALAASVENTFASTRTQVPEVDMKELIILALVVSGILPKFERHWTDVKTRLYIIPAGMMMYWLGEQSVLQHVEPCRWACTVAIPGGERGEYSPEISNVHGLSIYFGVSTFSIKSSHSRLACRLLCGIQTWTPLFQNRYEFGH